MISKPRQEDIEDFFRGAETIFPAVVVEARLIGKDGQEIMLNCNQRGIEDFRWHDHRPTWASWHGQSGTPLKVPQELGDW